MLDSQFRGMKQALENADPEAMQRVKDMMRDLNEMLDADARGEDTRSSSTSSWTSYGDFFPDNPQNLDELVDSLARRAAAAQRLMNSLSPEQQQELAELMTQAMQDAGLAGEMARLSDQLRARRPELDWGGRERMRGDTPLGSATRRGARGHRRPRRARGGARRRTTRAPRSTTSTRSCWSARSAATPSTTSTRCAGSSASWSGRATCSAPAATWS